jgi:hypoxanthine phosphoribosyltransferase
MAEPEHVRATYNDIHDLIKASATKIAEFKPNMIIAIGVYRFARGKSDILLQ